VKVRINLRKHRGPVPEVGDRLIVKDKPFVVARRSFEGSIDPVNEQVYLDYVELELTDLR
jgi:hypothetical protein